MLAVHDVVEIDVGDTFHFEKSSRVDLAALEDKAAERVFGLLPEDQAKVFLELWREFEARETPEAKFAAAIDRFMAVLTCYKNGGGTWLEYDLSAEQVLRGNSGVRKGSSTLWEVVERFVEESVESGFIRRCEAEPQSV
jgi:putative hydrolase of HD superfamily